MMKQTGIRRGRRSARTAALVGLAVLGACTGRNVAFVDGGFDDIERSSFRYAGAERDFHTVIVGNPFRLSRRRLDAAMIDAMQGRDKGMGSNFTTTPSDNALWPFRIVMLFNPEGPEPGKAMCGDVSALRSGDTGKRLRLLAAFCYGDELMYAFLAEGPATASPRDAGFRALMGDLMFYFVPYEGFTDERDDDDDKN